MGKRQKSKELSVQDLIDLEDEDQSIETGGDFERTLAPEGETMARFIEYVELGLQPQRPYMNKPKKPSPEVNIVFELLSPDNIRDIDVQGETRQIADKIFITLTKKMMGKAKFFKIFNAMRYGRDGIKHMKKMLGEAFILDIHHGQSKTDPQKVYANIGTKDSVGIRGPFEVNLKTRKSKRIDIPKQLSALKIFLLENPTKASWDSLFIDGTRTKNGEEVSKNFVQNKILASMDFEGSALQNMLAGIGDLPSIEETEDDLDDPLDDIGTEQKVRNIRKTSVKTKGKVGVKTKKSSVTVPQTKKTRTRSVTARTEKRVTTAKTASRSKKNKKR